MTALATNVYAAAVVAASPFARIALGLKALGEGLAAYHRYERLRARGVPHAEAASRSFAD